MMNLVPRINRTTRQRDDDRAKLETVTHNNLLKKGYSVDKALKTAPSRSTPQRMQMINEYHAPFVQPTIADLYWGIEL